MPPSQKNSKNSQKSRRFLLLFLTKKIKSQEINKKYEKILLFVCNRINNWVQQLIKYYLPIDRRPLPQK